MSRNTSDTQNMALFCDFENVALGVKDARYEHFDISKILERLLLKGSIVVKKAYCDWERYKDFKSSMHQASFEMIEIPHLRMSGKNSADIRMVVDALDLCYTKAHVDTFVIISGDSDFSPLVSKLRENNKTVIGVGVKNSTSDLLIANCDEFIFYDDLVREQRRRSSVAAKARAPARRKAEGTEKSDRVEKIERVEKSDKKVESNGRGESGGRSGRGGRNERRERGTAALIGGGPAGQEIMFGEDGVPPASGFDPLPGANGVSADGASGESDATPVGAEVESHSETQGDIQADSQADSQGDTQVET